MYGNETIRLAAVGDLHCAKNSTGALQALFSRAAEQADVLLLCGDLTDYGLPEEARILARELARPRRRSRSSPCSATTTTRAARPKRSGTS